MRRMLIVAALFLASCAQTGMAKATAAEAQGRVTVENDAVKLVLDASCNYVPVWLSCKNGSGRNLLAGPIGFAYRYVEIGYNHDVNEAAKQGQITNGKFALDKQGDAVTAVFDCDTPHFHMTRKITVPATGAEVKFVYELECKKGFANSVLALPNAPLASWLNKQADTWHHLGADGVNRTLVGSVDATAQMFHTGAPYNHVDCYFDAAGEGIAIAHVKEECAGGLSEPSNPAFEAGQKEKLTFVAVPFKGDFKAIYSEYADLKSEGIKPDPTNASLAIIMTKTPEFVIWADHATRKIFPEAGVPSVAKEGTEFAIEAAKGEYEPFQIAITPQEDLADVRLTLVTPLTNDKGKALPAGNMRYNPVALLLTSRGEPVPDLLAQKDSMACKKGQNSVFWVTVKVPRDIAAGTYRGVFGVTSAGKKLGDVPVKLTVWEFSIPLTPHICAFGTDYSGYYDAPVDLNNLDDVKAHAHKAAPKWTFDEYKSRLKFFAEHRLYETSFGMSPIDVQWGQKKDGPPGQEDFTINFTEFDRARKYIYDELHCPRYAYDPGLVPWLDFINQDLFGGKEGVESWYMHHWEPVFPKKNQKKYSPQIYDLHDDFTPEFKEKYTRYVKTIGEHCRANNICIDEHGNGPAIFIADEIMPYADAGKNLVVSRTVELARLVKAADPKTVVVINGRDIPKDQDLLEMLDMWNAVGTPEQLAQLKKMGKHYGTYYMQTEFTLSHPAILPRSQFWGYWNAGFYYVGTWAMTMSPIEPGEANWYGSHGWYMTDWWFPSMTSKTGEPTSTIRFELMREGLEDYEYLWMLRDWIEKAKAPGAAVVDPKLLARAEAALKSAEPIGGRFTQARGIAGRPREPLTLLAVRHEIAETLDAIVKATGTDVK